MPQYGKLKIDQFLYNNSGSDVTIDLANLALKANPTFTGTVTVPTAAAGDDSTKAASTAFVVASFATKASPTFTGTVTVPTATAGDNSTKAASTAFIVTSFAPKASPAFTGTATGVNLTLSGDLTVNGTTTTINTTTLQVEDKNIEIGKVSTPSDATADGGGITLLASSNKTILWTNSTDTWDFNQSVNIASGLDFKVNNVSVLNATTLGGSVVGSSLTSVGTLTGLTINGDVQFSGAANNVVWDKSDNALEFADNAKAIFGTSSDGVEIYHNGSNSYIKDSGTGNLVIQTNYLDITNAAGNEDIAKFISDGAVELYHNAVKKVEVTSTGLNVIGAITVNGAPLVSGSSYASLLMYF
tara:strand:+ start:129 stop:1199 length:1071 start_codon:yes stop_codon:yes gene_type:complete